MAKAFAAPSTALAELRGLKTEVYSLRHDKANAEMREADVRRELADLINQASNCNQCLLSDVAAPTATYILCCTWSVLSLYPTL